MAAGGSSSSSSSSEDEDWSRFQSAAVSVQQIQTEQTQVASQGQARLAGATKTRKPAKEPAGGPAGADNDGSDDGGDQPKLDVFQLKIAAALEARLERMLSPQVASSSVAGDAAAVRKQPPPSPWQQEDRSGEGAEEEPPQSSKKEKKKKRKREEQAREATERDSKPPPPPPPQQQQQQQQEEEEVDEAGVVRLFKRVKRGTPCVLAKAEARPALPRMLAVLKDHIPAAFERLVPQRRRPEAELPSGDDQALRAALAPCVVEGDRLLQQAAAGPCTAAAAVKKKTGGEGSAAAPATAVKLPAQGVVVEALKPFRDVSAEQRVLKLLGRPVESAAVAGCSGGAAKVVLLA